MRWLSGKGVRCQAGKPEFDPQHPHARRQNSSASCPLSPTRIPRHGHEQRRKRQGEGRGKEKDRRYKDMYLYRNVRNGESSMT